MKASRTSFVDLGPRALLSRRGAPLAIEDARRGGRGTRNVLTFLILRRARARSFGLRPVQPSSPQRRS